MNGEPVLVADIGFSHTRGALVVGGETFLLREPAGGGRLWPTAVALDLAGGALLAGTPAVHRRRLAPDAYRHGFLRELGRGRALTIGGRQFHAHSCVAALLSALRAEAERVAGARVDRVLLVCPGHYLPGDSDPRRRDLQLAGKETGFSSVSLVPAPVAAALAPLDADPFVPGDTVLVYDIGGGTFDTALVSFEPGGDVRVQGHAMTLDFHGGADLDALIAADVRAGLPAGLLELLSGSGTGTVPDTESGKAQGEPEADRAVVAAQTGQFLAEFAREVKHRLSTQPATSDVLFPGAPPYTLDRERLAEMASGLLAETVACARRLLEVNATAEDDLAGVLATGGPTRLPFVTERLAAAFGKPPRTSVDASLALVTGAAAWLGRGARRLHPVTPGPGRTPLSWPLPPGGARLERWLAAPGERFRPGQPLALLRDADGAQWQLDAPPLSGGVVLGLHSGTGRLVTADDWLVTTGPTPVPAPAEQRAGAAPGGPAVAHWLDHGARVQWIAFHPDGREFSTAGGARGIRVHGAVGGSKPPRDITVPGEATSLAYRHDGLLLASTWSGPEQQGRGAHIGMYDTGSGALVRTFAQREKTSQVVFSPDGLFVAAGSHEGLVRVFRAETGVVLQEFREPDAVRGLAYTPDGQTLATACADGTVRLHDLVHRQTRQLTLGKDVRWLAVSPDGQWIAATSKEERHDGKTVCPVLVHSLDSGAQVAKLIHPEPVNCLQFDPGGAYLATGSEDGVARVYTTGSWVRCHTLAHERPVWALAFAPGSGTLTTGMGCDTGTVTFWSLSPKSP
ncbi:Hsp70 family protein [Streptomyces sp. NPDC093224]|uniref:Hsp70 family protein n=1 Tax=Streptomyces sp. NPDC093224 TaxID=3155198 RepID=UPI003422CAA9